MAILIGSENKERSVITVPGLGQAKATIIIATLELRPDRLLLHFSSIR
ncbi:MAG: hypothetical protein GX261_08225 [Spirochaetales bacterium]|nr:hypothetical protein [Spirochaetales bacterium]